MCFLLDPVKSCPWWTAKTCPVHHKVWLRQEIKEWNREQHFRNPFSVLHTSLSLQKGQTASTVVCCKGRQSSTRWAITAQHAREEALLHQVTSAHSTGRGGEPGTCSLGATTAHSGTFCFFLPSPLIQSHNGSSQKPIWPSLRKNSLASDLTDLAFSAERGFFVPSSFLLSSLRVYLRKGCKILPFHCKTACTNHVKDMTLLKAIGALSLLLFGPWFHI